MKVVETVMVPKTRTAGGMFLTIEGLRDDHSGAGSGRQRKEGRENWSP